MTSINNKQQGLTMIELVITIVILSISLTAFMVVFANTARNSATPMAREQSVLIANAYMEELIFQPFSDPNGVATDCVDTPRSAYNDIDDYNCINDQAGAIDQNGNAIPGLEAYNVVINVTSVNDPLLLGIASKRIDVTVTRNGVNSINTTITTFRADY